MHQLTRLFLHVLPVLCALSAPVIAAEDPPIPDDTEIQTTASGLKYSVLQAGEGTEHPKVNDTVKVHYTGWLTTGKMFDSSRVRGMPAIFQLRAVIPGWTEGLQLMTPGSRFKFTIPPALGYGWDGSPPTIPADATLIFDVELIEITKRGREIPPFRELDPEKTLSTEGGIQYEIIEPGTEMTCTPDSLVGLEWSIYLEDGTFMNSTAMQDLPMYIRLSNLTLPFMKDLIPHFRVGRTVLVEIPYDQGAKNAMVPEGMSTIWRWHVTRVFDVPTFAMPADEELTTTESGLKYKILSEGTGQSPAATDKVLCHYAGWLTDGTKFDSSFDRGRPIDFPLNGVIPGWTEGLQLMKEGGRAVFVIPGDLGYGTRGNPPTIPPDATLVFVVDLAHVLQP